MRLSVIIPSLNGINYLSKCIEGLRSQTVEPDEVIIIDSTPERAAREIPAFDGLNLHFLEEPLGVPGMRSIGFSLAKGDVIATTEDHCIPDRSWCEKIKELHKKYPEEIIGGAVENGAIENLLDWSCYFCEYLDFMLPLTDAPGGGIPGNNVSYKRSVLERHYPLFTAGLWEFFIHGELSKAGVVFRMDPGLVVLHCKSFTVSDFQSQSYYFARSFGAMRGSKSDTYHRWLYRFFSSGLLLLVMSRLFHKVFLKKRRRQKEFLLSFPLTLWFQLCWCAGETVGYWFGEGESTKMVK
jgi:glycosyltransferase involved in cell wall biosynthesis